MPNTDNRNTNLNTAADAAALSVELPGDELPTPGAPGLINIDFVNDNAGSKQGDIGHFGTTDDLTPTLQGTIEGGEDQVLRIYANGVQLGSTTVGADGSWSFTPDTLEGGSKYAFEVVLKDPLTDEILVASETYTIITTASNGDNGDTASIPQVNGILDDIGVDKGPIYNGDTTDDTQPTVFGKADPGSVVVIYDNGQPVGSVTTNDKGNWEFTPDIPLADGEHSITAAELNADGNPGEQSPATDFIVDAADTTAPAAATDQVLADDVGPTKGDIHNGDKTDDAQPTLSGQAEAGATVIVSDNGKPIGSAVVGDNGKWTFTPDAKLADGSHSFSTVVEDAAGNKSPASDAIGFTVDTHADVPVIVGYLDDVGVSMGSVENGGRTDDSNGVLSGHAEAGSQISLTMWGPRGMKYSNVAHTVTDSDGNWHIQLSDGSRELGNRGNWTFRVTAVDEAGNSANSNQFKVNYVASNQDDTTAPDAATDQVLADDVGPTKGDIHNGDKTDDAQPTLSGQAEAGTTVIVSDNGKQIGSAVVGDNGKWTFTPDAKLADGSHSFSTVVEDAAGNKSPASDAIGFTVDTGIEKPVITSAVDNAGMNTGEVFTNGTTDDTTPLLKGTAEAGSIVSIYLGGNVSGEAVGSTIADETGHWTFQVPDDHALPVANSANGTPIWVGSVDAAGNSAASSSFFLNVVPVGNDGGTTPPEPPHVSGIEQFGDASNEKGYSFTTAAGVIVTSGSEMRQYKTPGTMENGMGGDTMIANAFKTSDIHVALPGVADKVTFSASAGTHALDNSSVTFYDAEGNVIKATTTTDSSYSQGATLDVMTATADNGETIASFTVHDAVFLGGLEWESTAAQTHASPLHADFAFPVEHADDSVLTLPQGENNPLFNISDYTQHTLTLTTGDILSNAQQDIFIQDGKQQMAVTGEDGDKVELKLDDVQSQWQDAGQSTVGGVTFEVYHNSDSNTELLVQQGVELHQS